MDYRCQHCHANLDGGDIYEHFFATTGDPTKAVKYASAYGWSETNRLHFKKSVIVQPDRESQYEICSVCKKREPFTPTGPREHA